MTTIKANDGKTYVLPDNPEWRSGFPPEPKRKPIKFRSDGEGRVSLAVIRPLMKCVNECLPKHLRIWHQDIETILKKIEQLDAEGFDMWEGEK